jgi:multiple sugar transport system permease protein
MTSAPDRLRTPNEWLDRLPEHRFGMVVAVPGLLLVGLFVLLPIVAALGMSFFRIELQRDDLTTFVGLRNYAVRLPADTAFLATLPLTLGFAVVTSAIAVLIALFAAFLIHERARLSGLLGLVLLLPWAVAPIADGILWRLLFEPRTGLATWLLTEAGLPPLVIRDAPGALIALGVAVTWRAIPLLAVLFLGALRQVPSGIRQAASLDGASGLQAFRYITLPAIAPVVIAACLVQIILALQVFEVQYALSANAPPTGSMLTGHAIFNRVIGEISLGYGSALTMVLGVFTAIFLAGLFLVLARSRTTGQPSDVARELDDAPGRPGRIAWASVPRLGRRNADPMTGSVARAGRPGTRVSRALARARPLGSLLRAVILAGAALLLVALLAGPILWIGVASTQPSSALVPMPPRLTTDLDLSGYAKLFDPVWQDAARVSISVAVLGTMVALGVSLLVAYPLARIRWRGASILLLVLLGTMLIPPIALAIPILFLLINLGLRDTIIGLVLINAAYWTPILIWLVRGAFARVPVELERAARIDGCSRLGAIVRASLPAAAPVIGAAVAIVFIGIWNDFVFVAVLGGTETHTLPRYLGETSTPAINEFAARIVLTVAPCIALVVLLRRRLLALR